MGEVEGRWIYCNWENLQTRQRKDSLRGNDDSSHRSKTLGFWFCFFTSAISRFSALSLEAELAPKRELPPGEATALEALLRGDGVLEKKNNLCKEEETLLEIQVFFSGHADSLLTLTLTFPNPNPDCF